MRIFLTLSLMLALLPAQADLNDSMDAMCVKIKSCSLAEVQKQQLSPEMEAMMNAMFDGMCKTWMQPYGVALGQAGLEDKAEACIDSVVSESCEDLVGAQGRFRTDECDEFEAAAEESDLDEKYTPKR